MKITLLGTGTSQGIPVIGCECEACLSTDPRDNRLRSGVLVEVGDVNILIDTGPDLRQQMLGTKIKHIDAILYTHEHNDHVAGLDDIRPFNFIQRTDIPFYGLRRVLEDIKSRYLYVFKENPYPGTPKATLNAIEPGKPFTVGDIEIIPISIDHGRLPILGYRIGDFSFVTDASHIGPESMELLKNSDVLVLSALQKQEHHSHFSLNQAIEVIHELKPRKAYLTHTSHRMGITKSWEEDLPPHIFPAYDGLELFF